MRNKIEHTATYLKRQLKAAAAPGFRDSQSRFFKQPVKALGVRTADVYELAKVAAKEYRSARVPFDAILETCARLWQDGVLEERILAVQILSKFKRAWEPSHWKTFDGWIDSLSNWAETDALCMKVLAPLVGQHRDFMRGLPDWTRSRNRWRRRSAAVALTPIARRGEELAAAFDICDRLAADRDDIVEKAVGWLLKEASRTQPEAVAGFLLSDIDRFSRTTVRYACEKMPKKLRARVMAA